jgi:hypothetical protein
MKPALLALALIALGGCGDDSSGSSGRLPEPTGTSTAPVTCESGTEVQSFRFDAANAGASSAREALGAALANRASVSAADFEGPTKAGDFEAFTYRSDGEVRVLVTVEDVGGSWRVERLEGCPPFIEPG